MPKTSKKQRRSRSREPWGEWQASAYSAEAMRVFKVVGEVPDEVWRNNRYEVGIRRFECDAFKVDGESVIMTHLSIKRIDRGWVHDWRELQRIKNELLGDDIEAVEVYPAEARLIDTANQYHLWALPRGMVFPWGYFERLVASEGGDGAVQRPFEDAPADAKSAAEMEDLARKAREKANATRDA